MWLVTIVIASLILVLLWFFERTTDVSFKAWFTKILPIVIVCELFYWWGFRHAPSFLTARYVMSGITHVFGWVLALVILHEGVDVWKLVSIGLIIVGTAMLMIKGG